MLTWFLNPWMLLGGLAIASPILIHLLNKRRFKIVEWAAMDFLFEADKKNRRRVQLENFILLALRCLALLLLALLLARPFLPSGVSQLLQKAQRFERVLVIDDSLSQRVLNGTLPAMQMTTRAVRDLVTDLANSDDTEEYLTVMLTSVPDQPVLSNEPLNGSTVGTIVQTLDDLTCSDQVADYRASMEQLRQYVSGSSDGLNRVAYVFSDMRSRDWESVDSGDAESLPNRLLNDAAEMTAGCFLIDTGSSMDGNLAVTAVRPDSNLVADKVMRFSVDVTNYGTRIVQNVRLLMQVDQNQPAYEIVPSIAPGETETIAFRHVFARRKKERFGVDDEEDDAGLPFVSYRVSVEIDRPSLDEKSLESDQMIEDSSAIFAARIMDGIPVLLVDGDPSAAAERSETHYLRSVGVPGTGLEIDVATVSEFETATLSRYSVIFLCNVDEASLERMGSLETWVREGGSLVLMPGNRVRAETFNQSFFNDGEGLSPLKLRSMAGDPTMNRWVNFEVNPQIHPALRVIVESDASSLGNVDVFSWWTSELNEQLANKTVSVPLRLTDKDHSIAMVDRSWGSGDVIVFTIPGDGDWSMWPSSPTFAPVVIDLVDYLVGQSSDSASISPGDAIRYPIDVSVYDPRVALRDPDNERIEAIARPAEEGESGRKSVMYQVSFDDVRKRGFHTLELKRKGDPGRPVEPVLFATNLDPRESDLTRLSPASLEGDFFSSKVNRVSMTQLGQQSVAGANTEIWMSLLMLVFGVLMLEQFLGWFWGRGR
jgi:hypothetical protein